MWHTFRPYLHNKAKRNHINVKADKTYKEFAYYDARQKAARTLAMRQFREMLLECRKQCLRQAQQMDAGQLELTDIAEEATNGR